MANPHAFWRAGVVAGSLGVALGCGASAPSKPATVSPAPELAPSSPNPSSTAAPEAAALSANSGELGAAENAAPGDMLPEGSDDASDRSAKVESECSALCASAAESCSRKSARECRANCGKYQSLADRCEVQVLGAIRCQAAVPKLVCSNVASECTTEFQALTACEQGEPSGVPATTQAPLPTGWARVQDMEVGFEVALPKGARVGELDGRRTWTAEGPGGASYRVAVLPALLGPATEKQLMESILDYLGHKCQPLVRLHGRFETDRDIAERFNARCEDGRRFRGLMRASREQLVLILEVLPPGATPMGDVYYYSFDYLKDPQNK